MAKKFDIGLKSKLNSYAQKFGINTSDIKEEDWFEGFVNYTVVSNIFSEDFESPNDISTGKAKGIDGIGVFVNNWLIKDEAELDKIGENEKIKLKICFIQSTIQSSFNLQKFQSFVDEVINILNASSRIEPFSDVIDKLFDEEDQFLEKMIETPVIELFFCSGKTEHYIPEEEIDNENNKFKNRNDYSIQFNLKGINFYQAKELKEAYDNIDKYLEILVKFDSEINLNEKPNVPVSLLSILKYSELKKIIVSENGLREKLFVENVRSRIENSTVNEDILKSLSNQQKREDFVYFNNGITILCERIRRHEVKPNSFYLKHPRIINGCQTSHMLYEHDTANPGEIENVEIVTKVIATTDSKLKKEIIFATNNQNAIDKDLESLNEFHSSLEEYYLGQDFFDIYYERLRGQYSEVSPPYKVINKETLKKIEYLNNTEDAADLFKEANEILENQGYLFERRGFYSRPKTQRLIKHLNSIA